MRLMWNGYEWHATELEGKLHLSRICKGCWATGEGYAGMWSTNRHTVEMITSREAIANRDANIEILRAAGLHEDADDLARRAGKFI